MLLTDSRAVLSTRTFAYVGEHKICLLKQPVFRGRLPTEANTVLGYDSRSDKDHEDGGRYINS